MNDLPFRDIHLPPSIPLWPPAFGWWILLVLALAGIVITAIAIKRYLKPTIKKQVLNALSLIEEAFDETNDASQCISNLSALLRRAAISLSPEANPAGLTGREWLNFLDQRLEKPEFSQGAGQILSAGPYHYRVDHAEAAQALQLCRKWVERL